MQLGSTPTVDVVQLEVATKEQELISQSSLLMSSIFLVSAIVRLILIVMMVYFATVLRCVTLEGVTLVFQ
jgi:heme/copper-type cytochrome/quinol oxidase subunit 2